MRLVADERMRQAGLCGPSHEFWLIACNLLTHGFPYKVSKISVQVDLQMFESPCSCFSRTTMSPAPLDEVRPDHRSRAAVVVAHPDDETLWCGGYILSHPEFLWRVVTLCRALDPDRAPKFRQVLQQLGAEGEMADLDDGPDQVPLPIVQVEETIVRVLSGGSYSLILTHGPMGEYTRHRRHEECSQSVVDLWRSGGINTKRLWMFAYEDGGKAYLPRVRADADRRDMLADDIWLEKRRLITDLYGYGHDSWEAQSTPREEGFWCFDSVQAAVKRTAFSERQS